MSIYTYNGAEFSEDDVIAKAKEKGMDLDSYINKFGIERIDTEGPGKKKPAVVEDVAVAGKKNTASKSVKPSSASQDNPFGKVKLFDPLNITKNALDNASAQKQKQEPILTDKSKSNYTKLDFSALDNTQKPSNFKEYGVTEEFRAKKAKEAEAKKSDDLLSLQRLKNTAVRNRKDYKEAIDLISKAEELDEDFITELNADIQSQKERNGTIATITTPSGGVAGFGGGGGVESSYKFLAFPEERKEIINEFKKQNKKYTESDVVNLAAELYKSKKQKERVYSQKYDAMEDLDGYSADVQSFVKDYTKNEDQITDVNLAKIVVQKNYTQATIEKKAKEQALLESKLKPNDYKFTSQKELDEQNELIQQINKGRQELKSGFDHYKSLNEAEGKLENKSTTLKQDIDLLNKEWGWWARTGLKTLNAFGSFGGSVAGGLAYLADLGAETGTLGTWDNSFGNYVSEKAKKNRESFESQIAAPRETTYSVESFGEKAADALLNQLPITATVIAAPEALAPELVGLGLGLISGTGSKYTSMLEEQKYGSIDKEGNKVMPKYNEAQLMAIPLLFGAFEGGSEYVGGRAISRMQKAFGKATEPEVKSLLAGARKSVEQKSKEFSKSLLQNYGEEIPTEVINTVLGNVTDKILLDKKDTNILDNVPETIFDTGVVSTFFGTAPHIAGIVYKPFMPKSDVSSLIENNKRIADILKGINYEKLSIEEKSIIDSKISALKDSSSKIINNIAETIGATDNQDLIELDNISRQIVDVRKQAQIINNSSNLSDTQKKAMLSEIKSEYFELNSTYEERLSNAYRQESAVKNKGEESLSIDQKINKDLQRTKQAVESLNIQGQYDVPDLNTANDVREYLENNTNLTSEEIDRYEDSNGVFIPLKDGKQALIINKEEASMAGMSTTGLHETGHALIYKAISDNKFLAKKIGTDLYNHIEKYIGADVLSNTQFKSRYDQYKADFEEQQLFVEKKVSEADNLFNKGQIDEDTYTELKQKAEDVILKAESKYLEETIPLLSESLEAGDIKYNENFFTKLGDIIRRALQKFGIKNINFETGKDVFDFVRDYNKSFKSGKFNKAFKNLATKGEFTGEKSPANLSQEKTVKQSKSLLESERIKAELKTLNEEYDDGFGDITEEEYLSTKGNLDTKLKAAIKKEASAKPSEDVVKKEPVTEEDEVKEIIKQNKASVASDKVQKIYDEKGKNGAQEIINLFKPITKRIVDKRRDAPGFDKELLTDEIETGVGGILDLITKYNPGSGIPLAAYINKYLPVRAIATSKRILDKEFSKDVTEEKGLMAEETVSEAKEKPKYTNALEAKVFEPEALENINKKILSVVRTLKSRIDAPVSINRTVSPLISEIREEVGKQVDIDVKTAMGGKKDNQLKNWLLKNKKYILENMTTTWLMGKGKANKVEGGIPNAVQKRIDGRWTSYPEWVGKKPDRESVSTDSAGRTSGAELVRRLPNVANNVSNEDFLDNILEPSGNPIRGRKESLAKAIAEEASFDIILDDLANEGIIFEALKANQERLGVEMAETISVELARQAERGNIKQSKKIAKEALTILRNNNWDLNNTDYEEFVNALPKKEATYITDVLNEKSTNQLVKYLSVIELEDKEFEFRDKIISALEDPVENVRSKINRFKLISDKASKSSTKLNDLKIQYKNNTYNFELKLDKNSRLKGVVINNVTTNPIINKDTGINEAIYDKIKADKGIKAYTDYLLENGGKVIENGNINVPLTVFKDIKARELQNKAKVVVKADADLVKKLNNNTNDAITFGEVGTFSYGDTKFDGVLPDLQGDVDFEITTQRGSVDKDGNVNVYFIGFPKMAANWDQKSTVDIHAKPKKLLTIIRKASLLKRNKESAKATNVVLNASRPNYTAAPKKINVIDIDESLKKIKKKVAYKDKNGITKKLSIPEYLKLQIQLELDGILFDYSDIQSEVKNNKDIFGDFNDTNANNNFGITIEPSELIGPMQTLLNNVGINIKENNINTLENNTEEAKVEWITDKFYDGFNDFYIYGNDLKKSKEIKDILENFDVKSEKQQEKLKFFNSLDGKFNKIIAQNTGIGPMITYSDITAKRSGRGKNMFDLYVPSSAADFELLLYNFLGKGELGEQQKEFFNEALLKPYSHGTDLLDAARQSIKNEYKQLLNDHPGVNKKLEQLIPSKDFTYDQAVRVAMWSDENVEIPGLSQRDSKKLTDLINSDTELKAFKDGLIITGRQGKGWTKPSEYWDAETIISDLHNLTEGDGRKKFLAEFISNYEQIFGTWKQGKLTGPNINKVEALYGTDVREALEDILYRMTTGKNRTYGNDKETGFWANWVSGSTGAIMFLNVRSAALQLIGAVNFLNLRDNNPYAAAKAFANQKQYWEDFALIWNSDKMKERRGGLKEDVAAAEIANAASGSKNKVGAVLSYLLKIGYTPTQMADSFAIASGGAPFYRNRIKTYLKEGMTEQEAENAAWDDFTKVSDETQQSGDPRDISKQQASPAGRLLLTFQNTAMQQSRIVKKAVLDLKNGRGDAKTNFAKIAYYVAIQNTMFAVLQQGLFAVAFDYDDEDEEIEYDADGKKITKKEKKLNEKLFDVADGVIDTILRGTGFMGGIIATVKNMAKKYLDERDKKFKADYAKVVLEGANLSPPIGSKLRKLYSGLQQTKFDKDLIEARGWDVMQDGRVNIGPMYSVTGKVVEAFTNVPMDRLATKVNNASEAMNSQNTTMQRIMVGLGWSPYSAGIEDSPGDKKIREEAKAKRKIEGVEKAKETRERTKDSIRQLPVSEQLRLRKEAALERREKRRRRKMG